VAFWHRGKGTGVINEVTLHWARLLLGWVTVQVGIPPQYVTSHPGQLSLAIPHWVGTISTGDGFGHH